MACSWLAFVGIACSAFAVGVITTFAIIWWLALELAADPCPRCGRCGHVFDDLAEWTWHRASVEWPHICYCHACLERTAKGLDTCP